MANSIGRTSFFDGGSSARDEVGSARDGVEST